MAFLTSAGKFFSLSGLISFLKTEEKTVSDAHTLTVAQRVLFCGTKGSDYTVTLYAASGNEGELVYIKNIGTDVITIDGNASETIDGNVIYFLAAQYQSVTLYCDGTNWYIQ